MGRAAESCRPRGVCVQHIGLAGSTETEILGPTGVALPCPASHRELQYTAL